MRVTIATRIFPPEPAAAAYRLDALATALRREGHVVDVRTVTAPGAPSVAGVRRFPVLRNRDGAVRGYVNYLSFDVPLFFRLLFAQGTDVVVAEPPPTTGAVVRAVAACRRIPYVYYAADVWSDASEQAASPAVVRVLRLVERWALRGARAVIAVSDGVGDRVRELAGRDDVTVVPNGVDTAVFSPDGPRQDGGPLGVYAGTMSEWQGADIFVRALPALRRRVPDARLVFLGQGSAVADLSRLASELGVGDAVEFPGLVPPAESARWLRSADAALVSLRPGLGYDFAVPTKIFAATSCGTPVVFAGEGAAARLVDEASLGTAVGYDVAAVAAAMTDALTGRSGADSAAALHSWTVGNASLSATGRNAAREVVAAATTARAS